ncbi:PREDICTED: NACHT, LRR and PYD domains-containing protein 12-like [Nanorana parkeri]|uniref:NACHT, LRR and PYD domains-containing protein 12-like n=1 Tax=Nanorana parkeri TaxID=125878 RepID=UPI000854F96C|nr:PREDICTED: NACHT, LRR and PYD domains-containing protein 12-like [Nanorana parkeri]
MEQTSEENAEDDLRRFRQKLSGYEMHELRIMYEHFKKDLVYIVKILNTQSLLAELKSRKALNLEDYESMKRDLGDSAFSEKLVQDVLDAGREAVIKFWECLYSLQTNHPHHNLLAVLSEIQHVEKQQLLDENGHSLDLEIQEVQQKHKEYLLKETQNLKESQPPGTTLESQSFPISERYVDLVVVSTESFRLRTQHELIEIGEKHESCLCKTQRGLERVSPKRLFRWCHQIKGVPNVIMISGVPGVGKTTLMQKFVCDWVNGKLYQRFSFVFFFKFRELNRLKKVSLEEMILHQYPHLNVQLENILKNPEQLLFIFDGLDESCHKMDSASSPLYTNTRDKRDLGVILVNLLRQTLLKGCSVLLTSRPAKVASIDADNFQLICEVMGFFHEERKMYFVQYFGDNALSEQAFGHVRDNEALYTFCYIPSYCWIICKVLSMCFQSPQTNCNRLELLPKTVTQLFVIFISNILTHHSQKAEWEEDHKLLLAVGWLAEYGVMNHVIVFEKRDLISFMVDSSLHLFTSFMMKSSQPSYVNYSFLHLTIQEFMAALVHHVDYAPGKLQQALDKAKSFQDGRAEIFLSFLFGLSDGSTKAPLKGSPLNFSTEASKDVITWLGKLSSLVKKTTKNAQERKETLNIFNYLFESRNKALVSELLGQNLTLDFSRFNLSPLDCTVLAFILKSCQESKCLDLEKCYLESECWERLSPGLHTVHTLRLHLNALKDEDIHFITNPLTHPDCKIQNLSLTNNDLTSLCCPSLASGICGNLSLTSLDLTSNNLTGTHFSILIDVLSSRTCMVKHLVLCAAQLTHDDSQCLVSLSNNPKLEYLNVSHNHITDAGSGHIRDLIEKSSSLKEIRVAANGFSEDVIKKLESLKNSRQDLILLQLPDPSSELLVIDPLACPPAIDPRLGLNLDYAFVPRFRTYCPFPASGFHFTAQAGDTF